MRQPNTSLFNVSYSTSHTANGRFLLYHSAYFTFPGTRKAASLALLEAGGARIQFKRREPSASSLPPHILVLDAITVDPILATDSGEGVAGKAGATIDESLWSFSVISSLGKPQFVIDVKTRVLQCRERETQSHPKPSSR
jgi:hypothetical protein